MINVINGETPFQILSSSFSIGPSETGYELQVGADSRNFTTLFSVGANTPRMVTNVANGSYFRLKNNVGDVKVNWQRVCVNEGGEGGSGTELQPVADFPLNAVEGTVISYTGSSSASGVYQYDGTEWTEVGANIDLSAYWTSAETQSAITAVEDHLFDVEQVTASALTELHDDILELSGRSVDLSAYYTSAQTEEAISAATSGKADAANAEANPNRMQFPTWNEQGVITSTNSLNTVYQRPITVNDNRSTFITPSSVASIKFYAPTTSGNLGEVLVSTGNGAPVWSAVTFPDVSNYVTSAQVETQIEAKGYITSADTADFLDAEDGLVISTALNDLDDRVDDVETSLATKVSSTSVSTIWKGTAAEYEAITVKDPATFYIIVSSN